METRVTCAAAFAVLFVLAGCTDAGPSHRVGGTFTEDATQDQMNELGAQAEALGGGMAILESFPAQFMARGFSLDACQEFRSFAAMKPYVKGVGACEDDSQSGGDDATSHAA